MAQIIAGVAIGMGLMSLVWFASHLYLKNRELGHTIAELQKRLSVLEATARTRMPHEAKAELLDALAVISQSLEDRNIADTFLLNIAGHINNALEVGTIHQGHTKRG